MKSDNIRKENEKYKQYNSNRSYSSNFNNFNSSNMNDFDRMLNDMMNEFLKNHQGNPHFNQNFNQNILKNTQKLDNAYKLLKLSKIDNNETIKKTHRKLAIKWHPDKWVTSTEKNKKIAENNFKKLQSAYDLIKNDKSII